MKLTNILTETKTKIVGNLCRVKEGGQFASCSGADSISQGELFSSNWRKQRRPYISRAEVSARAAELLKEATVDSERKYIRQIAVADISAERAIANGDSTKHNQVNGRWTPEREALHKRIINEFLHGADPGQKEPVAIFMGGLTGAGKTSATKGRLKLLGKVNVNADDIKEKLPEYDGWNAAYLHEESSHIADKLMAIAARTKRHIVYDGTMKTYGTDKSGTLGRIKTLSKAGYRLEARFVDVDIDTSVDRAVNRFINGEKHDARKKNKVGGRYVPLRLIRKMAAPGGSTQPRETFNRLKSEFSAFEFIDNRSGPKVLAASGRLTEIAKMIIEKKTKKPDPVMDIYDRVDEADYLSGADQEQTEAFIEDLSKE